METTIPDKIEIAISKGKTKKSLSMSVIFVLICLWIVIYRPVAPENSPFGNPMIVYGASILGIVFFGAAMIYYIRKLSDKRPGFILDNDGMIDNSSGVSIGRIPWDDLHSMKTTKVMRQEFLILMVHDPRKYIDQQTNILKKKGMEFNFRNYGSPLAISANGLECNLAALMDMIEKRWTAYKNGALTR